MRTRIGGAWFGVSILATALMVTAPSLAAHAAPADDGPPGGEYTIGYDNQRTNLDSHEPGLSPSAVQAGDFGQIFSTTLPGTTAASPNQLYAQPLVVGSTVIAATDDDEVAGLDAQTGTTVWHVSLGTPWTPNPTCGDLAPHIGVTSTPVYDPATDAVYLAAKTASGPTGAAYTLHALDPANGQEKPGWPVTLAGTSSNGGELFNPTTANQRPGLLLLDGAVYLGFASHCDHGPYVGYVIGVNTTSRAEHLWSTESQEADSEAGIWQSGGGLVSDGPGQILLATGNGLSPAPGPGTSPPGDLAESVVRLQVLPSGDMVASDFFSPANNAGLDQDDADLGSGGPIALPDSFGTAKYPHLMLQSGKDGSLWLLNRDALGGNAQGPGGGDAVLAEMRTNGLWGRFAAFSSSTGNYVLFVPHTAPLTELRISADGDGNPTLSQAATSADSFAYTTGSPVVTSVGDDVTTAVAWVVTVSASSGANAYLRAYSLPLAAGAQPLKSFAIGTAAKFVQPATAGGRLYVGTRHGQVLAFGRPTTEALGVPSTEFGQVAVGSHAVQDVTVTATKPLTVSAVHSDAPFSVDTSALTLPVEVDPTYPLDVPVTFSPSAPGAVSGLLTVTAVDADGNSDDYVGALHGTGTQDGLGADPATIAFGDVNRYEANDLTTTITNTGTGPATITEVDAPSAPYSLLNAPAVGTVLPPQGSLPVTVRFAPTDLEDHNDQFVIHADTGSVTVALSGTGFDGQPVISLNRTSLDFGDVVPGMSKTLSFTVANTGTATLTITKAPPPAAPFSAPQIEGQDIAPGDSLTVAVTFTPTSAEPASDSYSISGAGTGHGAQLVALTGNAAPWVGRISSPIGCLGLLKSRDLYNDGPATIQTCEGVTRQYLSYVAATGAVHYGGAASGYCLTVPGDATKPATKVTFAACTGAAGQRWTWRSDDSLYNPHAKQCLGLPHGVTKSGTQLLIYTCNHGDAQYWDLSAVQAARGLVSSAVGATNQYCVDIRKSVAADGTPVQLYPCNSSGAQIITHVGGTLRALGRCLDIIGGGTANGTKVDLYRCNGTGAQTWNVLGGDILYNPQSGKCLDDPRATTASSTQLQIWNCFDKPGQNWRLPG